MIEKRQPVVSFSHNDAKRPRDVGKSIGAFYSVCLQSSAWIMKGKKEARLI
jgi:hypothetical protein